MRDGPSGYPMFERAMAVRSMGSGTFILSTELVGSRMSAEKWRSGGMEKNVPLVAAMKLGLSGRIGDPTPLNAGYWRPGVTWIYPPANGPLLYSNSFGYLRLEFCGGSYSRRISQMAAEQ